MRKNLLLTFIALTLTLPVLAYNFSDDSTGTTIYYNIVSSSELTVEVTYNTIGSSTDYTGSVTIPETVTNNGTTYAVTAIGDYAFSECEGLTSVTIPASVTTIGEGAFTGCSSLQEFVVEEGNPNYCTDEEVLFNIGKTKIVCFPAGSSLATYTIPESVTSIGIGAFAYCSKLTSVSMGNNVTTIEDSAFLGCMSLTSITFGGSVEAIGMNAFLGCESLTSVIIPDNVTTIETQTFFGCSSLTEITIPNNVTTIGEYAFYGCGLKSVVIGEGVASIGERAFAECGSLSTMTILRENPPSCGSNVFDGVTTSSITLYVPKGCSSAYSSASTWSSFTNIVEMAEVGDKFEYNGLYYNVLSTTEVEVTWGGESKTSGTDSYTGSITIPKTAFYGGLYYDVIGIGDYAFNSCALTSVDTPSSVTYIGIYAFQFCKQLTSIEVPSTVETLGYAACASCTSLETATLNCGTIAEWAFNQCDELTAVIINSATIGSYSFEYCSNITSLTLGDNVATIGEYAFDDCKSLTELTIPDSVTEIGECAFHGCTSLETLNIGSGVTTMGDQTFQNCTSLTTAEINCPAIGAWAFQACSNLATLTLGADVTTIGQYAFADCTSLTELTIPNSVTEIGECAFYGCTSLETLTIGSGVTTMGDAAFVNCSSLETAEINCPAIGKWAFQRCSNLASLTFGDSVTTIGYGAFIECTSLTELTIPNSVTEIGDGAFYKCMSLTSVTIGSSVETIGEEAFSGCTYLTSVTTLNPTPPSLGGSAFYGCNATISVPAGTIDEYEYVWGDSPTGVSEYIELGYAVIKIEAEEGYATYYNKDYDVTMPDGITAYVASSMSLDEDDSSSLSIRLVGLAGLVPAGTAVVIKGAVGTYLYVDVSEPTSTTSYDNMLYGSSTTGDTSVDDVTDGYYFYKLTRNQADEVGSMGFYWGEEGGVSFSIPGNKAWLAISQSVFDNVASPTSLSIKIGEEDDVTTGISSVESTAERPVSGIYTLQGVRVSDMGQKGVYIVDGKKVVKR